MADYLEGVDRLPVFPDVRPGEVRAALPAGPPEEGEALDAALADFREVIVPGLNHWNHPAFFGYFSITGSGPGILGEMLAAALNVNAMVWRSSPAATELEDVTTDWLRQLLGLPVEFEGVINDTASSSSLYALAAAREVAYRGAHRSGLFGQLPGRVYASDQAHSSIEKAVLTLGLGRDGYHVVASGPDFGMRVDALRAALDRDRAAGIVPVAVVATLGTTSTAAMDPVRDIVSTARAFGAWCHVDAAYGGPAAIVPELRPLFDGWEGADSIVVNPHKWLFTPVDCSILYCRKPQELVRAFSIVPEYLTSSEQGAVRDLMDYGWAAASARSSSGSCCATSGGRGSWRAFASTCAWRGSSPGASTPRRDGRSSPRRTSRRSPSASSRRGWTPPGRTARTERSSTGSTPPATRS